MRIDSEQSCRRRKQLSVSTVNDGKHEVEVADMKTEQSSRIESCTICRLIVNPYNKQLRCKALRKHTAANELRSGIWVDMNR